MAVCVMEANSTFYKTLGLFKIKHSGLLLLKRTATPSRLKRWNDWASSLLFVRCGDKEGVDSGVLVMSDLDDELWDSQPDVVEEP